MSTATEKASAKTVSRKSAEAREKDLRLAMYRIERGRAKSGEPKLSISAVAREAGVTTALIHNHYPKVAEDIRTAQGKATRAQRDAKVELLKEERSRNRDLREQLDALKADVERLASINEVLLDENATLKARLGSKGKVVTLGHPPVEPV